MSDKMQKTLVVQVRRRVRHAHYGKVVNKAVTFKVHDEKNDARAGDTVRIAETRPLSKEKRWRLVEVISRGREKAEAELKDEAAEILKTAQPEPAVSEPAAAKEV